MVISDDANFVPNNTSNAISNECLVFGTALWYSLIQRLGIYKQTRMKCLVSLPGYKNYNVDWANTFWNKNEIKKSKTILTPGPRDTTVLLTLHTEQVNLEPE